MLGINSPRELVTGNFAREVRASLRRSATGRLTKKEKESRRKLQESQKEWAAIWR